MNNDECERLYWKLSDHAREHMREHLSAPLSGIECAQHIESTAWCAHNSIADILIMHALCDNLRGNLPN